MKLSCLWMVFLIVPWSDALSPSDIQAGIEKAIASGAGSFIVPFGIYVFGPVSLTIDSARNFILEGSGSTFVFYPGYGVMATFCTNTVVRNVTVDYSPSCFTQGTVVAVNVSARTVDVSLDDGFPLPNATANPFFASSEIKLQFFDPATRMRIEKQSFACIVAIIGPVADGTNTWRVNVTGDFSFVPSVGVLATLSPRVWATYQIPDFYYGSTWHVHGSANVTSENIVILGGGNFAISEWGGEGGHTFRNMTVTRPRDHLLSPNLDGFHSFSTGEGATLLDSSLSWFGDDALNYHNRVAIVLSAQYSPPPPPGRAALSYVVGAESFPPPPPPPPAGALVSIDVVDVGDIPAPNRSSEYPARALADLAAGDVLRLSSTLDNGVPIGNVTVVRSALVDDESVLKAARFVAESWPGVPINPASVAVWRIDVVPTFTVKPDALDIVQFDRRSSANGRVVRSNFSDNYDSMFRLQSSGTRLDSCNFTRVPGGITVVYDPVWLEGKGGLNLSWVLSAPFCFSSIDRVA